MKDDFYKKINFDKRFDLITHDNNDSHTDHVAVNLVAKGMYKYCSRFITMYSPSSVHFESNYYIGLSSQPEVRIARHNKAQNKTTKPYAPFRLIHTKDFKTRIEARRYEKYLKSGMGREYLDALENSNRER